MGAGEPRGAGGFDCSLDAAAYAELRSARLVDLFAQEFTTSKGGAFSRQRLARRDGVLYGASVTAPFERRTEAIEVIERLTSGFALAP